jgi:hypothetical protein
MKGQSPHNGHHNTAFISETAMEEFFSSKFEGIVEDPTKAENFKKWYQAGNEHPFTYRHDEKIGRGEYFDCDTITDAWFEVFLTIPISLNPFANPGNSYEDGNVFLFNKKDTFVYFAMASPFRKPDFRRITMTRKAPLLVPLYNMYASSQDFPSLKTKDKLIDLIKKDLSKVRGETFEAKLDGEDFYGCCVIRNEPLKITNIPKNNVFQIPEDRLLQPETGSTIDVYHGGFWLLIREDKFTAGDHLLYFKAESANYEIEAKILINALV